MGHVDSLGRDTGLDGSTVIDASGLTVADVTGTSQLSGFPAEVYNDQGHVVEKVRIVRKWTGVDDVTYCVSADGRTFGPRPWAGIGLVEVAEPPEERN